MPTKEEAALAAKLRRLIDIATRADVFDVENLDFPILTRLEDDPVSSYSKPIPLAPVSTHRTNGGVGGDVIKFCDGS